MNAVYYSWFTISVIRATVSDLLCFNADEQLPVHVINAHAWFIAQGFYSLMVFLSFNLG